MLSTIFFLNIFCSLLNTGMQSQWIQRANCKSACVKMDKMGLGCRYCQWTPGLPGCKHCFLATLCCLLDLMLQAYTFHSPSLCCQSGGGTEIQIWWDSLQTKHITWSLDTLSWVYSFLGLPWLGLWSLIWAVMQ